MLPAIWPSCVVHVTAWDGSDAALGDLVLYTRGDRLILHRVVARVDRRWITRGDRHPSMDRPLGPGEVIGRIDGLVIGRIHARDVPASVAQIARRAWLHSLPLVRVAMSLARPVARAARRLGLASDGSAAGRSTTTFSGTNAARG
jgi:hypothetical protein